MNTAAAAASAGQVPGAAALPLDEHLVAVSAITYKGKDRRGVARGGRTDGSPAVLVKRLFDQRWLWVIAERDGVEVGGIGFSDELGKNTWWAEGDGPEPGPLPAVRCRIHGDVADDHFPCRRPGESAAEFTSRALGETRDV